MMDLKPTLAVMSNRSAIAFAVGVVAQIALISPAPDMLPRLESLFVESILHTVTIVSLVVSAFSRPLFASASDMRS